MTTPLFQRFSTHLASYYTNTAGFVLSGTPDTSHSYDPLEDKSSWTDERDALGIIEQLVAIGAVLLGSLATYWTNAAAEKARNQDGLLTRWDDKKLSAYEGYVDCVRECIFMAVRFYEDREGIRASERTGAEMVAEMAAARRLRGQAFERIMLLGGDVVIEAAHELNAAAREVDWQADREIPGSLDDWRERNRAVFRAINEFHDSAREDLGVQGQVRGGIHPDRDLLLPPARTGGETPQGSSELAE
ncbi:hypothetical protein [Streptacidiphilus albus]|uniref:hypothetical protein n=1 Tax=Streptacidiphilus albus TaxID=105425 RepID=UPI001E5C9116|nr:hypothetical protein [Streptacidiphilus albus]